MYPYVCNIALGAFLADRVGTVDFSVWFLYGLGALLIVTVALVLAFLPAEWIDKVNQRTYFKWTEHRYLHIGFLPLIFLAGLALIGAGIWLEARSDLPDPSRILDSISGGLVSIDNKTAALHDRSDALITKADQLSAELDSAQQKVDKATKAAITLVLNPPPGIEVSDSDVNEGKVTCHYSLSSDPEEYVVKASGGPTNAELKCRIRNISPREIIMRITVQVAGPDRTGKPKYIGYYTGADPALPNYDLRPCLQNCSR